MLRSVTLARCAHHGISYSHLLAVTRGSSTLLLGVGPSEDPKVGQKVHLAAGDVIILPAGVSHCSVDFQDDYFYLGFYPLVCQIRGLHSVLSPPFRRQGAQANSKMLRARLNGRMNTAATRIGPRVFAERLIMSLYRPGIQ